LAFYGTEIALLFSSEANEMFVLKMMIYSERKGTWQWPLYQLTIMLLAVEFTVSQCRNSNTSFTSSVIQCLRAGQHFVFQFIAIEGQMISPETSTKTVTKFCATTSLNILRQGCSIRGQPATTSVKNMYTKIPQKCSHSLEG